VHDDRQACADAGWWYFWGRSRDDPLPSTEPDPARARQLLERACPYGSGERERRGCDDLAIVLLFTEPLSGGKGRAIALLERGCLHGATPPCAYLGLADELGLAGRARDPARALARYDEACNVWRVHVAWAGGRRGPVLRRPSTRNTVACFRLARRAERGGLGGRHHLEVAAQLYAEVCLYDHTLRLFPRACARASRLMLEYGFEHRYTSLERSPIVSGLTFTSTRARNPMAVEMAQVACRWGSLEGCALLRSIVLKGP
jgi:TPR repeat protein